MLSYLKFHFKQKSVDYLFDNSAYENEAINIIGF